MDYLIAVNSPAYGSQGAYSAYQFAQALLQAGHRIRQIFFFQEGVSNGNGLVYPANDEFDMVKAWQQLSREWQIPLGLCVAAAQRRGVVDAQTARADSSTNLAEGFAIVGLGEFMMASLAVDRVITL